MWVERAILWRAMLKSALTRFNRRDGQRCLLSQLTGKANAGNRWEIRV